MRIVIFWLIFIVALDGSGNPTTAATVIVASKESLHKDKADFTCDGMDDHVEIQQAIDAIPAVGGRVTLLEGTFLFGDSVEITKDNVTVRGMGRSTVLKHQPTRWVELAQDAGRGSQSIEVADVAQFRVGQIIGIGDEATNPRKEAGASYAYYNNYFVTSHFHLVTGISGNTITLDRPLEGEVLVAKNAGVGHDQGIRKGESGAARFRHRRQPEERGQDLCRLQPFCPAARLSVEANAAAADHIP